MNPKLSHIQTLIQQRDFPNAINQLLEITKDSNYYKEGGLAALEKALDNSVGAFAITVIKSWINR